MSRPETAIEFFFDCSSPGSGRNRAAPTGSPQLLAEFFNAGPAFMRFREDWNSAKTVTSSKTFRTTQGTLVVDALPPPVFPVNR
jgi:hypothetical protein